MSAKRSVIGSALVLVAGSASLGCSGNELGNLEAEQVGDLTFGEPPFEAFDASLEQACGPTSWAPHAALTLARRPYVQHVVDDRATIVWQSATAEVAFGLAGQTEMTTQSPVLDETALATNRFQWLATFEGLEPASIYCYTLRDPIGVLVEGLGFRTAPAPDADTVRLSVFGDLGKRSGDQLAVLEQLKRVRSDLVLVTGDVAYDDGRRDELTRYFFGVYDEVLSRVPFFPASGNHDYHTLDGLPFREAFVLPENGATEGLERWYSFDWGPLHVAVLDTEVVEEVQRAWLADDLGASDRPWKIAVLHRPPYSSGHHGSDDLVRDLFVPVFEEHGVQVVFAGHDHDYERTRPIDGITYVVTGAGGIGTREVGRSDFTAFSQSVSHFTHVAVQGDRMTLWAIDATGQVFDTAQITR